MQERLMLPEGREPLAVKNAIPMQRQYDLAVHHSTAFSHNQALFWMAR